MRGAWPRLLSLMAALVAVSVVFIAQSPFAYASPGLKKIHDPRKVTYSIRLKSCRARDKGQLPDPACTPGSIDYAKYHVAYPAYHIKHSAISELDHLVPLELGGSNDITNLWPEVGKQPNPKDKVEDALNRAVCEGKVSLTAAQNAIASDWITAEARLGLTHSRPKAWCTASAVYNSTYNDYDVYVHSNQPYTEATATASNGESWSYETNGSGYADIYLYADPGDSIQVIVGAASCSTTAG